jgi:NADPH2:quinone reductase
MRAYGAADVVSTRDPRWASRVGPVDRVFDLVGGPTFAGSVAALRPHGRLVFVGGTGGGDVSFSAWDLMHPVTLTGYSSETLTRLRLQATIHRIASQVAAGRLRVARVTRFALEEAAAAHEALESGRAAGRVVLVPAAVHTSRIGP